MDLLFLLSIFTFMIIIAHIRKEYENKRVDKLKSMEQCPPHKWEPTLQPGGTAYYIQCSRCKKFSGENYGDEI